MTDQTHAIDAAREINAGVAYSAEDWRAKAKQLASFVLSLAAPGQSATDAAREIVNDFWKHDFGDGNSDFADEKLAARIAAFAAAQVAAANAKTMALLTTAHHFLEASYLNIRKASGERAAKEYRAVVEELEAAIRARTS